MSPPWRELGAECTPGRKVGQRDSPGRTYRTARVSDCPVSPGCMGLSVPKWGQFQANGGELVTPGLMGAKKISQWGSEAPAMSSVNPPQPSYTSFKKLRVSTGI